MEAYIDVYWVVSPDKKSISGYNFFGGNLVAWYNKKQNVVAIFNAKVEFELWYKGSSSYFGFKASHKDAINIALNVVQHERKVEAVSQSNFLHHS